VKNNYLKIIVFLLILGCYALQVTYKINLPAADDITRHIMNGEQILQGHFNVLYQNVYSYTLPEQQFVNHHWLSGVIFYLLAQAFGWNGLVVFKVILLLATFSIIFLTALKKSNFWLVAVLSIPAMFLIGYRSGLRPELFSYLLMAVFIYLLMDAEEHPEHRYRIFWLIPLELLWVNLHIFFIAGIALIAGFLLERLIIHRKNLRQDPLVARLSVLFVSAMAVCVVNPNGVTGALYPFRIFSDYGMNVSENGSVMSFLRSTPLSENMIIVLFFGMVALLTTSFIIVWREKSKPKPIFFLLAFMATTVTGYYVIRFISNLGVVFLPAASRNLSGTYEKIVRRVEAKPALFVIWLKRIVIGIIIVSLCYIGFLQTGSNRDFSDRLGIGLSPHSMDAAQFFKANNLQGPIFNDYDIGSYLIYNLYPKERVFVDNRPEAYTEDFFHNTYLPMFTDENVWQANLAKYDFNVIFVYRYDEGNGVYDFLFRRMHDPAWSLVYADNYAVIFVRNIPQNQNIINQWKITPDNVAERMNYLIKSNDYEDMVAAADNLNLVGRPDLGLETFFNVVHEWPNAGKIWMVMGQWELGDNNPKSPLLAIAYIEKAIELGYNTSDAYSFLGSAFLKIGHITQAKQALEKSISINPNQSDAKAMLMQIEGNNAGSQ
jgi:Tetratricopeptide repeat